MELIKKGEKVRILEHLNGWLKITHQGRVGYIRNLKQYIHIISISPEAKNKENEENDGDIKPLSKEAENIDREIEKGRHRVLTFTREESAIVNRLNDIDLALNQARKRVSALRFELAALRDKTIETTRASESLKKRIEGDEDYIFNRLAALYKMNWLGSIYVLASAQSMYELFKRKKSMEIILAYDEKIRQNLLDNKAKLQQFLVRLNSQKMEKLSLEAGLKKQIAVMSDERVKRSSILVGIRKKRSLELALLESLNQAAANLNGAVKSLNLEIDPLKQNKNISPKSFSALKGLLNMPVKGKIVIPFGPHKNKKLNMVNFQSGIEIKADRGEPIRSVFDGQILYADWFKGYGNMIIIDHGENYYTVYAHAEELFASKGDNIDMGDVVATVGDSGSMIGPSLHFEVRHHGKPMDPLKWIKKG
ncbi:MAG: peptidoglycan DD-metalloendopeptidase family protein [Deltaproteobacteria bacterium]|nr:peptidoglycan DD-metalloendopeptidase family protein [Deltaproteobacteria bacterium]